MHIGLGHRLHERASDERSWLNVCAEKYAEKWIKNGESRGDL
ncbi:hypothetical protein PG5_21170 [Pseudomonas sp. G5(2012)]|nr:hypothetical protein PG5_21170 [Pseudomonas sp. G5(2012)]